MILITSCSKEIPQDTVNKLSYIWLHVHKRLMYVDVIFVYFNEVKLYK